MRTSAIRRFLAATPLAVALVALPAASAQADVSVGVINDRLVVSSDGDGDVITLSAGSTVVTVKVQGTFDRSFSRSNFDEIIVEGGSGVDRITVDPASPIFTDTEDTSIGGGNGNDVINGANGPESIFGDDGDDVLAGAGGVDRIEGGGDEDEIHEGPGNDHVDGGSGDDTIVHSTGDGSDDVSGEAGTDTLSFTGSDDDDVFHIGQSSTGLVAVLTSPRAFRVDASTVEKVGWGGFDGDDSLDTNVSTRPFELLADGGTGNDAIEGGPLGDELIGSGDGDVLVGNAGADKLTGGTGMDTFTCDASDTVFDFEPGETQTGCVGVLDPSPAPEPPAPEPPGPSLPEAPENPGAPASPPANPVLPPTAGALAPRIGLARKGLRVVLRSTHSTPVDVVVAAKERRGRKLHRYRRVRKTIPAGGRVTVTLKAPRSLVKQLRLARRGKRRPVVTVKNLATGAIVTARR
jgi:hypothetical protein